MNRPLLDSADFVRLTAGGSWSVVTRHRGLPPPWPVLPEAGQGDLIQLGLEDHLPEFHRLMTGFLGLAETDNRPLGTTKLADYASGLYRAWAAGPREVVFYSSGSTGLPKPCPHREDMLIQELEAVSGLFQSPVRVLSAAPLLHSYGFVFGLLLPKALGRPARSVAPLPGVVEEALAPGDLLIGFPWLFDNLAQRPPASVELLTSTAPCPDQLFTGLVDKGYRGLTEIYGSSETGAVAYRQAAGPFSLLEHWTRSPQGLARTNPAGGGTSLYPLLDYLDWMDDREFRPRGRLDQAVQVGGVNVYPQRVARLIEKEPGIREAAVRLMAPGEGGRLKAFVVPEPDQTEAVLRPRLLRLIRRLNPPERPTSLSFGPELPRTPTGKLRDWEI